MVMDNTAPEVVEEQAEIAWAESLLEDFKPIGVDENGNGKAADPEPESKPEPDEVVETESKPDAVDETAVVESDAIGEADYARKVEIKAEDGTVGYKTVKQLIDEGMLDADYRRKTQEHARQRDQLKQDQTVLDLINKDKHARDYLLKRIDDIKAGKQPDDDLDIPADVLEQLPWLKSLVNKVKQHDVEVHKSRTSQEQTQADQTVGKIVSIMDAAQAAIETEIGTKLEPREFQARVGKGIIDSLSDNVPEDSRVNTAGQMILADKNYFLTKAREAFQQELELAKDKTIAAAQQERTKKAQKPKPLTGGSTASAPQGTGEFKIVKDKDGRPDMDAFLDSAFANKGG